MNPFAFAKVRHIRTQTPPKYNNYRNYKPYLRTEFAQKCVYCRSPDTMFTSRNFGADHYRPKHRVEFMHLRAVYENLFYCCSACNTNKGKHWPEPKVEKTEFVPNPCDHIMFMHLRFQGDTIQPHSEAGKWTINLLDLNAPDVLKIRQVIISAIASEQGQLDRTLKLLAKLEAKVAAGQIAADLAGAGRDRLTHEISAIKARLKTLSGEV